MSLFKKLQTITEGSLVKRYHTRATIHGQNNAEHQFFVASIALLLYPNMGVETLKKFLWHDVFEHKTGDLPWKVKRDNPALKAAIAGIELECQADVGLFTPTDPLEHALLKVCEYFECLIYCRQESTLGNRNFAQTEQDCLDCIKLIVETQLDKHPSVKMNAISLYNSLGGGKNEKV